MKRAIVIMAVIFSGTAYADLKCGGTEPFWSLTIKSKDAVYENMAEGLKTVLTVTDLKEAQGLKPGQVRKYQFKGDGLNGDAVVQKQKCNDGMSDITYPYSITFSIGKSVLSGCCR